MVDINKWTKDFLQVLEQIFGERVYFAGLQGSYGRGEATESSDIDMVVILDRLMPEDIQKYSAMLDTIPERELICGFLSGKNELLNWDPSDLFQFYHDTEPLKGSLDDLLKKLDGAAVERAIKLGACNIYHGCVHNMLYGKREEVLRGLYKSASFVVQAICFKETGRYLRHREELMGAAAENEREIIRTFGELKNGGKVDFEKMSEELFLWSGRVIRG